MKNILILIGTVYLLTLLFKPAPAEDYNSIYNEPVILYATDWCGYCKKVKQIFAQKGVAYKEFNIETSSQSKKEFKALQFILPLGYSFKLTQSNYIFIMLNIQQ